MAKYDDAFLKAALIGYESEKARIEETVAQIRAQLGLRGPGRPRAVKDEMAQLVPKIRSMSASGRRRIAAAQRERWAALKQQTKPGKPKQKRRLSAAGRKAIIEATKKRWAAFRAAKAKTASKKPTNAA